MGYVREALRTLRTSGGYTPCDGVRALAMLWVIVFHTTSHLLYEGGTMGRKLFNHWWTVAVAMSGDAAVDLFLVLSGFLLGTALIRDIIVKRTGDEEDSSDDGAVGPRAKPMSPGSMLKFYVRRWFRIAPAYISAIILSTIFDFPITSGEACPRYWWCNLLFINNYYPKWDPLFGKNCMVHSWSVAVEWQLYFISPPLFAAAACLSSAIPRLTPSRAVIALCACLFLLCCVVRTRWMLEKANGAHNPPYVFTQFRMSSYVSGVVAGMAVHEMKDQPRRARTCMRNAATSIGEILAYAVIVLSALFGCEPAYFIYNSELGSHYAKVYPTVAFLHACLLRPLFGASAAYLLVRAVTDRAPLLSKVLSLECWRPWAGLSYSMYLLQYLGWKILFLPLMSSPLGTEATPVWLGTVVTWLSCVLVVLGTLPLALANYVFVERAGMLAGKRLMAACHDAKEKLRTPATKLAKVDEDIPFASTRSKTEKLDQEFKRQLTEATTQSVWVEIENEGREDKETYRAAPDSSDSGDSG